MQAQQRLEWSLRNAHPSQHNQIKAQQGPALAQLYKDYIAFEVDRTVQRMMQSRTVKESDFMNMIKSATRALKCNEVCVGPCTMRMFTLEEKAECLATCGCYDVPQPPEPAALMQKKAKAPPAEAEAEAEPAALQTKESVERINFGQIVLFGVIFLAVIASIFISVKKIQNRKKAKLFNRGLDSEYLLIN